MERREALRSAMPASWKGTLVQYAGRLHRKYAGKREVQIYDCVGSQVPVLARMLEKRLRGYAAMGYKRRVAGPSATSNDEAGGFEFGTDSDDVVNEELF
jgi:superfamily II DNA or RNA helicase